MNQEHHGDSVPGQTRVGGVVSDSRVRNQIESGEVLDLRVQDSTVSDFRGLKSEVSIRKFWERRRSVRGEGSDSRVRDQGEVRDLRVPDFRVSDFRIFRCFTISKLSQ